LTFFVDLLKYHLFQNAQGAEDFNMSIRSFVRNVVARGSRAGFDANQKDFQTLHDVDQSLSWLLRDQDIAARNDVVGFVGLLRGCIEPMNCRCVKVKGAGSSLSAAQESDKSFNAFVQLLEDALPPLRPATALRVAKVADDYRSPSHMSLTGRKVVSHHFGVSSSAGRKGRILSIAVKYFRPQRILEVGTAYGFSSLFMGISLQEVGLDKQQPVIHTLEGYEPQATLSRELLGRELNGLVHCAQGRAEDALKDVAQNAAKIDLAFHDAGHMYDDYVRDFAAMEPYMARGSILILDDIRWNDPHLANGQQTNSYAGWQSVVSHERVKCAAEIDGCIGIALML
jgi:predicted O-methyltransferase YrrM